MDDILQDPKLDSKVLGICECLTIQTKSSINMQFSSGLEKRHFYFYLVNQYLTINSAGLPRIDCDKLGNPSFPGVTVSVCQ